MDMIYRWISLLLNRGLNMTVPFILIPFTISIFGIEEYGKVGLALSLIGLVITLVDFGHELSFKGEVHDCGSINGAFSAFITTKILMFVISYPLAALFAAVFLDNSINFSYFLLLSWRPLEVLMIPKFLFIYTGKIKQLSYYEFSSRLLWFFILFIVNFLKLSISYYLFGQLVISILYILLVWKKFELIKYYKFEAINFPSASQIFGAKLSFGIYNFFIKQLVSNQFGFSGAGIYELGEKVLSALKMPMGALLNVSLSNVQKVSRKVVFIIISVLITFISILVLVYEPIFKLFDAGRQLMNVDLFKTILILGLVLFSAQAYFFGYKFLNNDRKNEYLTLSIFSGFLAYLIIIYCSVEYLFALIAYDVSLLFLLIIYHIIKWIQR